MAREVYLEKFTVKDFDNYYKLVRNEEVMAMITERAIPLDEARNSYELLLQNNGLHQLLGSFKVVERETGEVVGLGKLEVKETGAVEAELGYMLLPAYWGRGLGSEIARLLVEKARTLQLNKLIAIIDPNNIPSRKILLKQGFISDKVCEIDGLPGEILSMNLY